MARLNPKLEAMLCFLDVVGQTSALRAWRKRLRRR
jgi:hypothetical protein